MIFWLAALGVFPLQLIMAQASPSSSFADTTWNSFENDGGTVSTITFNENGEWTESWKDERHKGHWEADPDDTKITVRREDGVVLHYSLDAYNNLVRDSLGDVDYKKVSASANQDIANSFGSTVSPSGTSFANALRVNPFSGTTWTAITGGIFFTINFRSDGKWTEDSRAMKSIV
jgi:hypothetical protein